MADTNFTDNSTRIIASWLNDVNNTVYKVLGNPADLSTLQTTLGLTTINASIASLGSTVSSHTTTLGTYGSRLTTLETGTVKVPDGSVTIPNIATRKGCIFYYDPTTGAPTVLTIAQLQTLLTNGGPVIPVNITGTSDATYNEGQTFTYTVSLSAPSTSVATAQLALLAPQNTAVGGVNFTDNFTVVCKNNASAVISTITNVNLGETFTIPVGTNSMDVSGPTLVTGTSKRLDLWFSTVAGGITQITTESHSYIQINAIATGTIKAKMGFNTQSYQGNVTANPTLFVNKVLATGVKKLRLFQDVSWGVGGNINTNPEIVVLKSIVDQFTAAGGEVLMCLGMPIATTYNLFGNATDRTNFANYVAVTAPRSYTALKTAIPNIKFWELGNEWPAYGGDPNVDANASSGKSMGRAMEVLIPQLKGITSTDRFMPSSQIENGSMSVAQGCQWVKNWYNELSSGTKAMIDAIPIHSYDHVSTVSNVSNGIYKKMLDFIIGITTGGGFISGKPFDFTEYGWTDVIGGQFSGATTFTTAMIRDLEAATLTLVGSNVNIRSVYRYQFTDTNSSLNNRPVNTNSGEGRFGIFQSDNNFSSKGASDGGQTMEAKLTSLV